MHTDDQQEEPAALCARAASRRLHTAVAAQGEEADVVVVSLVRSNTAGHVGFLREPERINVMMSRARDGLIIFGNAATLLHASRPAAREHWGKVLSMLRASGCVFTGVPAMCQQHKTRAAPPLRTPADFEARAPDGGCCMPCNQVLPCGHRCMLRCHSFDRAHTRVRCQELVHDVCSQGHITSRRCSSARGPCHICVQLQNLREKESKALAAKVGHRRGRRWGYVQGHMRLRFFVPAGGSACGRA